MDKEHLYKILNTGTVITSSGTTGTSKKVFQPVEKLQENNKIAIDVQKITKKSKQDSVAVEENETIENESNEDSKESETEENNNPENKEGT